VEEKKNKYYELTETELREIEFEYGCYYTKETIMVKREEESGLDFTDRIEPFLDGVETVYCVVIICKYKTLKDLGEA
jgi:hypothetical protein